MKFEDTYPEKAVSILSDKYRPEGLRFESYNFGVCGYNTLDALFILKNIVLAYNPDMVVLGYAINDAESALFKKDKITGRISRNPVEEFRSEGLTDQRPADKFIY